MKMGENRMEDKEEEYNSKKNQEETKDSLKLNTHTWLDTLKNIKLSQEKKEKVAIVFLLGVFFLLLATPISTLSDEEKVGDTIEEKENDVKREEMAEKDAYIELLENKLEQTIEGMEGAGNVLIMITLKDSGEKILDKNQPYESSSEKSKEDGKETEQSAIKSAQETVLIEEGGNTQPIVVQELYPDIEGVVVVCEGGDNSELALRIKEVVQALFSIDAHKVVVCKLQT